MEPREQLVVTEHLKPGPLSYGVGIGAAALGIGLGVLLLCWGLSLLSHTPRPAEIVSANPAKQDTSPSSDQLGRKQLADGIEKGSVEQDKNVPPLIRREVTEFRSIDHEGGEVTTGWQYADGRGGVPVLQYCYYVANVPGTKHRSDKVEIAIDGKPLSDLEAISVPNVKGAEAKCQWWTKEHTGLPSRDHAPQPHQQHGNEP